MAIDKPFGILKELQFCKSHKVMKALAFARIYCKSEDERNGLLPAPTNIQMYQETIKVLAREVLQLYREFIPENLMSDEEIEAQAEARMWEQKWPLTNGNSSN